MARNREFKTQAVFAAISLVALLIGFQEMIFRHLPGVFCAPEEDLAYGWYVPLFSLYVLWVERKKFLPSLGRPSWGGVAGLVPFLLLGLIGARGLQVRFELIAFVGLLIFGTWTFFGRAAAKRVLFPALFLLFCLPVASAMAIVTVPLRLLVSTISAGLLSGFGMDLIREGNRIILPNVLDASGHAACINIADPCSGLRSIFALLAISAGYGYFTQPTWLRRGILFALAVPLAMIGNIVRISSICIVAKVGSPKFALGAYHDLSGYLVFLVAVALLIACSDLLIRLSERRTEAAAAAGDEAPVADAARPVRPFAALVAFLLIVPVMSYQAVAPKPVVAAAPEAVIPECLTVDGPEVLTYQSVPFAPSEAETNLLINAGATVSHSRFFRRYGSGFLPDDFFNVSTVVSGENKGSLHRPELCLPSNGGQMTGTRSLSVDGVDWTVISLEGARGMREDGSVFVVPPSYHAYTFYNQEGFRTDSHMVRILRDTWDRTFHNRVDRWVMVTVTRYGADERRLEAILKAARGMIP